MNLTKEKKTNIFMFTLGFLVGFFSYFTLGYVLIGFAIGCIAGLILVYKERNKK